MTQKDAIRYRPVSGYATVIETWIYFELFRSHSVSGTARSSEGSQDSDSSWSQPDTVMIPGGRLRSPQRAMIGSETIPAELERPVTQMIAPPSQSCSTSRRLRGREFCYFHKS